MWEKDKIEEKEREFSGVQRKETVFVTVSVESWFSVVFSRPAGQWRADGYWRAKNLSRP
jgi:hypothetical protein